MPFKRFAIVYTYNHEGDSFEEEDSFDTLAQAIAKASELWPPGSFKTERFRWGDDAKIIDFDKRDFVWVRPD